MTRDQANARAKVVSSVWHGYAAVMRDAGRLVYPEDSLYFVETDEHWADAAPRCTSVQMVSEFYDGEVI